MKPKGASRGRGSGLVHGQSSHGGVRAGAGAPVGNANGQKRIIALPEWLDLEKPESIRRFLREVIVPAALSGRLGVRTVTAVTSICKVLLDSQQAELLETLEARLDEYESRKK